jgi:hypothetical protein
MKDYFYFILKLGKKAVLYYNTKLIKENIITIKALTNYLESLACDSNISVEITIDKSSIIYLL